MDSGCGPCPSPVFPDGTSVSLPIPSLYGPSRYNELRHGADDLGTIAKSLSRGRFRPADTCHLDPDLTAQTIPRPADWRPAFGQVGAAQKHLEQQEVAIGDVFLFFGWFRDVVRDPDGNWKYKQETPGVHRLFGWLQIGAVHCVGAGNIEFREHHPQFGKHPHLHSNPEFEERPWSANNTIYVASDQMLVNDHPPRIQLPGAGVFTKNPPVLTLTDPDQEKRSIWRLPACFHPDNSRRGLSYHNDRTRWTLKGESTSLRSVGRGREFVFDASGNTQATDWLIDTLQQAR